MRKRLVRSDRRVDPCAILLEFRAVGEGCQTLLNV